MNSEHVFTNPGGYIYQIICFSKAEGIVIYGEPTDFFSWFRGTSWKYALCKHCKIHIGWQFCKKGSNMCFYGLIKEKLIENNK